MIEGRHVLIIGRLCVSTFRIPLIQLVLNNSFTSAVFIELIKAMKVKGESCERLGTSGLYAPALCSANEKTKAGRLFVAVSRTT
jgi:hypothetical protein